MTSRQTASAGILGAIEWESETMGYCKCPGESMHSHETGANHCRVTLDKVPTIFCFHTSCGHAVDEANHRLRSDIGKVERGLKSNPTPYQPTPEDRAKLQEKRRIEELRRRSAESLPFILQKFHVEPADIWEESPVRLLDDPSGDWRLLVHLFELDDVIWVGDKKSSCNDEADDNRKSVCRRFFRPVEDWLLCPAAPANFTCPSTFKPGSFSRSNANVLQRKFLVIESDCLSKTDMLAVIQWCRGFMRLRAIVDTAGKSLHGWFDAVTPDVEQKLRIILPNLGRASDEDEKTLDPALFKLAQPCRLPGALRDKKYQNLYYLDLK